MIASDLIESKDTMITQRIRNWLRRVFTWWPWRQTPPVDYRRDSGALSAVMPSEGKSLSTRGGTTPQAGATSPSNTTPCLSTIEERPAFTGDASPPASEDPAAVHPSASNQPADNAAASSDKPPPSGSRIQSAPTQQQRLEFLRYLVHHGIVNEGKEE